MGSTAPPGIDHQSCQQAWLDGIRLASVVRRVGGKLVPHGPPSLCIDERRMLAGIELALVGNLTDVDRVREQLVDVPAGERFTAALDAARRRAALCHEAEAIGLVLD